MLIDSHCHLDKLDLAEYGGDLGAALAAARDVGVESMLCIGIDLEDIDTVLNLAQQHEGVYASVGVHPLYRESREPELDDLLQLAQRPKVVAIGETGLDYFYGDGDLQWQRDRFDVHIAASNETGLPLIVHTRGAKQDTLAQLHQLNSDENSGVLHCFTEDLDMAKQAVDMGFLISISGIVTFRNASELRDVVKALPLESLLVETDSPWLAPVPHRGKKNQPKFVREVAQQVADEKGVSLEQVAEVTTDNFFKLFRKAVK